MDIGSLQHHITIERPAETRGQMGSQKKAWAPICQTWARVQPLSGRALEVAQALHAEVTVKITIRHRADVDNTCRVMFRGNAYAVQYVLNPSEANRELQLYCTTGTSDG
jgi:SPP1 family predicted phage head-tail adaptor